MATGRVPTTANSPLTAKGDLFGYSTTQARVPVGSDGETLVADSSASTGLRWNPSQAAGKNYLINGGFDIWQRGTSFVTASGGTYGADRWYFLAGASTTFAQDTTQLATGARYNVKATIGASAGQVLLMHALETPVAVMLAGQTVTVSASVAASASTPFVIEAAFSTAENVGPTGSWTNITAINTPTISGVTSLTRFSASFAIPSNAKSVRFIVATNEVSAAGKILYFSNIQAEVGSVATAFSRAGGTLAGELAACMRYFRSVGGSQVYETVLSGTSVSTTSSWIVAPFPVQMRTTPTISYSALSDWQNTVPATASQVITGMSISTTESGTQSAFMNFTHSANGSFGSNKGIVIQANNTTNARITWSAEL